MAASPVKFLFGFLFVSIILWLVFIFASRILAWLLSQILGASVGFRVGGWKCLRDVVVKFRKGAIESVSVGEIRLSLRQSLVKLGVGFISRDPKLQILICDLEVVMRPSSKSTTKKSKSRKPHGAGRGKWMFVANMARFLSVSVTDLVMRIPKASIEVKELNVDISKDGSSRPTLLVKLHLLPIVIQMGESGVSGDQYMNFSHGGSIASSQSLSGMPERSLALFSCEELCISCEFGHDSEGVSVKLLDVALGDVSVNLNEDLLKKKNSSNIDSQSERSDAFEVPKTLSKKQSGFSSFTKYSSMFPDKVCFNLPKLYVRFEHQGHDLVAENNIMGIQLKSTKSQSSEDMGESTRLDVQIDLSGIHLFKEAGTSLLEILKVDVVSSVYVPTQPTSPVRAEIDVKLGGTRCNIIMSRLKPWMNWHLSQKKGMVLKEESSNLEKWQPTTFKAIMWTCTVSAPEMTVVLYRVDGLPLYHGCSQSSHVFANNISSMGTAVHMELGELNLHLADEYPECLKESLFGVEVNSGSLMHVPKVSLDWGRKDVESGEDGTQVKLVLSVDVTGMSIFLTLKRVESLLSTAFSSQALLKNLARKKSTQSRGPRTSKSSGKGIKLLKFNLERCSIVFYGDVGLDNVVVPDPKRMNYGSQGGIVTINVLPDGTERTATVMSTKSDESRSLKYSISFDIFHVSLCVNKEKQSTQVELERARSNYHEYLEEQKPCTKLPMFDMKNAKFVRRTGGLKEVAICSFFSAADIAFRWEPDLHLSLVELMLHLKLLIHNQKLQAVNNESVDAAVIGDVEPQKDNPIESGQHDKQHKKRESVFAVDVELLTISAEAGDGVEVKVQVQSIFSENARIGVLLEGLMLSFNGAWVFKSGRMQISRIPNAASRSSNANHKPSTHTWDWVVQGLDVHICMPYRLPLRAIDDAVEDMLRGLKLITAAKTKLIFPVKKESSKSKKPSRIKFGCVKFAIRKLTADIEEEPIQGWLDEHYRLLKNEACELAVRLKFLDELISEADACPGTGEANDSIHERKINFEGTEIDVKDSAVISKLREEIYKQSFQSYYKACQNLVKSEGSGACMEGFQAGFKPSTARTSLLAISATDLEVTLTRIEGGDTGMIEVLQELDPVCLENKIPFSRLFGSNIVLRTGSLVVQLRDYTFPMFSATYGKCEGHLVLAQQATCFQPQISQEVYIGRWRKVQMLRSASGTTPPLKTYMDLPLHFQRAEISFGVGYEPSFADISYAFTVALRRTNISVRNSNASDIQPPKKEKSLPWWDDVRNYIHGKISLFFSESRWNILATTDPYEKLDKLQLLSSDMEILQSDGRVFLSAKDLKFMLSSSESLAHSCSLKLPTCTPPPFLEVPVFTLEVTMDWDCESGNPLNHYLHALPVEGEARQKVLDPFRSTSLSLRWNFSLRPSSSCENPSSSSVADDTFCGPKESEHASPDLPVFSFGAHDLAWLIRFWNMNYIPPYKLRTFSRWPRFGIPRVARSGNLSLDKVMTEFMLRIDATPSCIKHLPLHDDDPAKGLTFKMTKLKYELCYARGKQKYTFECKRDTLDLVYQGLDIHILKANINKQDAASVVKVVQMTSKSSQSGSVVKGNNDRSSYTASCTEKHRDDGFLLSSDYFTIRRQAPKADPARLLAWQEAGRKNLEMTYVRSEFENGSESDEHIRSDPSDDDGYNVVIADNCQRVFVYGLKLLWTIENRDAVWSWVGGISKAFQPPKPSPSRQYAQRKLLEEKQGTDESKALQEDTLKQAVGNNTGSPAAPHGETSVSSQSQVASGGDTQSGAPAKDGNMNDAEERNHRFSPMKYEHGNDFEEGTRHFMVNVIEPQFNLHSEEANGRFLLAAVSGRVLARSFHSIVHVGYEMIEQALGTVNIPNSEGQPEMTWKRMELSVMLEHVQAHVAPTDVDPGAGLQWLPKILRSSPKVKRTGALLERVFMPCDMYFRYTRHKGGTPELKVKPLKELTFSSHNITATMTSRQFQVMLDVLTNLLFARLPKPRKSSLSYPAEEDDDIEEEADEVVPDGVEEVELAKISLEQKEREKRLILDDIRTLSVHPADSGDPHIEKDDDLWMINGGKLILVQDLKKELGKVKKSRKEASVSLRMALQNAAQLRLMEKEKNKSPSYAMRISLQINKVVWGMLVDGKAFAEAEINDMIYDFDRDYKDVGVARFTTKYFVVRNCLPNAKCDMLLSAWNPPPEWGKKVMLRVDAKQGAPKDGHSPLELFQVEIYPLKIHLTETMYRTMWEYLFPEEEQDSQRRQEVWKVSTTAKRIKKGSSLHEASGSGSHPARESEATKLQNLKANIVCGSTPELRRTSSFDRSWEETVAESVANELVLHAHSSSIYSSKSGSLGSIDQQDETSKNKSKESKPAKSGRSSHEDKKGGKSHDEKRSRPRKMMEFHNIKISQVELLVTYEGSRFAVSDLRLLMDTFHRVDFTGTWRRLFSRVKKHIIWGVLKSGKKFKDKSQSQREPGGGSVPDDLNFSDSDGGQAGKSDQYPVTWLKRPGDGAGDGFVTSIRGLFNSQRRKAKAFVLRTMRGEQENEFGGEWSESDVEFSPFARQLTITKAKRLIRRHTKKFRSRGQKGLSSQQKDSLPSSPRESTPFESDSSSGSPPYEDFQE
ncbi:FMP27, GFWDK domain [Dillenia turbinata]|uniref:FMP27, GFWDK domain n=1 Tax=Dillenia turbinata TaxID=194707 RepID=A0AAN8VSF5_9MAGN